MICIISQILIELLMTWAKSCALPEENNADVFCDKLIPMTICSVKIIISKLLRIAEHHVGLVDL